MCVCTARRLYFLALASAARRFYLFFIPGGGGGDGGRKEDVAAFSRARACVYTYIRVHWAATAITWLFFFFEEKGAGAY